MWLGFGVLLLIGVSQCVLAETNNATAHKDICTVCKCDSKEKILDCRNLNLFKLFDDEDWEKVTSTNNTAMLNNVEFDYNGIDVVTQFPQLDIRSLSFRHNKIRKIEAKAFINLTSLEKLDLSDNRLTNQALEKDVFEGPYSTDQYEPLRNLRWLSLADNDIHSLKPDVFAHLSDLEVLFLNHNPFKIIDPNSATTISSLTKLKFLDLSFMELRNLPVEMLHAPRDLQTLNLTGNLLTVIPEGLHFAINLIELNLNDNPFVDIGGDHCHFPKLPKLETLSISSSHTLRSIGDGAFQNLSALQHLYCHDNQHLSSIHPHAFANAKSELNVQWPPLRSIILTHNNLSVLNMELIEHWKDLEEIDLQFNPWKCTCENQWMVDKLIPIIKTKNAGLIESIRCETPVEMKSRQFTEMSSKGVQMRCDDTYGHRPERDGPILVGVFIGLCIGIPLTMALLYIYRRGCFGFFGYRPSPADYGRAFYKRTEFRDDLHI